MFRKHPVYSVLGTTGVVLGAWYLLTMLQYAFFGPLREPAHGSEPIGDINARELAAIVPICVLCLWIGVMPQPILDTIQPDVDAVMTAYPQEKEIARTGEGFVVPKRVEVAQRNF
jgi:NADH-quinone oxidoreductase subunit M